MQWVVTKYQTTAKCSYKYTLTISFLNINGSWNIHQILLQNISILSLRIFLSFFTSSANTLLILRSSQDMAGFCVCDFCLCSSPKWYRDTVVMRMECNACWTFLEKNKNLPYSCTAVKFYRWKSSHQITWCKSYWFPAMGELRRSPETLNCTSSVTGFCPLSTDYKYSVLESCLFTNVIEFHGMMCFDLSSTVAPPVAIRTWCDSHWQFSNRNILPVLVGKFSKAAKATTVAKHCVPSNSVIW